MRGALDKGLRAQADVGQPLLMMRVDWLRRLQGVGPRRELSNAAVQATAARLS